MPHIPARQAVLYTHPRYAPCTGTSEAPAPVRPSLYHMPYNYKTPYARRRYSHRIQYCVFLGRERTLCFRGVVSLPPQSPPSLPALDDCRCGLHMGLFSLESVRFWFCVLHAADFLCGSLRGVSVLARTACFLSACG